MDQGLHSTLRHTGIAPRPCSAVSMRPCSLYRTNVREARALQEMLRCSLSKRREGLESLIFTFMPIELVEAGQSNNLAHSHSRHSRNSRTTIDSQYLQATSGHAHTVPQVGIGIRSRVSSLTLPFHRVRRSNQPVQLESDGAPCGEPRCSHEQ